MAQPAALTPTGIVKSCAVRPRTGSLKTTSKTCMPVNKEPLRNVTVAVGAVVSSTVAVAVFIVLVSANESVTAPAFSDSVTGPSTQFVRVTL